MALGIYKQGQGYWVRMLTAIFAGVLVLAGAAWAYQNVARIRPPSAGRDVRIEQTQGAPPAAGTTVELFAAGDTTPLGTATVKSVSEEAGALLVRITGVELSEAARAATPPRDAIDARSITAPGGFRGSIPANGVRNVDLFPIAYVQAAVAGVIILIGAFFVYHYVGQKPKPVDFLIATDAESRKVNWSTRKEVIGSTWVVIGAMFLIAATLFVIDLAFQGVFTAIGVLER